MMGLYTRPAIPFPTPIAPPLNPFFLAPLYGSPTIPHIPNATYLIADYVPRPTPLKIFEAHLLTCLLLGILFGYGSLDASIKAFYSYLN